MRAWEHSCAASVDKAGIHTVTISLIAETGYLGLRASVAACATAKSYWYSSSSFCRRGRTRTYLHVHIYESVGHPSRGLAIAGQLRDTARLAPTHRCTDSAAGGLIIEPSNEYLYTQPRDYTVAQKQRASCASRARARAESSKNVNVGN